MSPLLDFPLVLDALDFPPLVLDPPILTPLDLPPLDLNPFVLDPSVLPPFDFPLIDLMGATASPLATRAKARRPRRARPRI